MVGFGWGGWVTGGSAELTAKTRSDNAVVAALAPICLTQFQKAPDAAAQQDYLQRKAPGNKRSWWKPPAGHKGVEAVKWRPGCQCVRKSDHEAETFGASNCRGWHTL